MIIFPNDINRLVFTVESNSAVHSENFRLHMVNKHAILINQHQLDTLSLDCLLGVSASTCFGRYSSTFRRLCTDAIWCNCVRRMCVD
jgi:hypothetical protein